MVYWEEEHTPVKQGSGARTHCVWQKEGSTWWQSSLLVGKGLGPYVLYMFRFSVVTIFYAPYQIQKW